MIQNFQSESKRSGDAFEELVYSDLVIRGFDYIDPNVYIDGAGCEVDFVAHNSTLNITEYVEAKGGFDGKGKRPGAKRTDNVKKAIANGALIKCIDKDIKYVVYFSSYPTIGYCSEMINTALDNYIIDEVRFKDSF
jgi:predicted AAA+ superfamily ATPase